MNGSEVARMKAKSFCWAYLQGRELRGAVQVLVQAQRRGDRARDRQRPGDPPLQDAVGAELRDDHVDRREARVARGGGDRGRGLLGRPGGREERDPEQPRHERLAAFEDDWPPVALTSAYSECGDAEPPASLVTLIPAGPEANAPSSGALATTSRIAQSTCVTKKTSSAAPTVRSSADSRRRDRSRARVSAPTPATPARPSACWPSRRRTAASTRAVSNTGVRSAAGSAALLPGVAAGAARLGVGLVRPRRSTRSG